MFTGQGSQTPNMCKQLFGTDPEFSRWMKQCALILDPLLPRPLLEVVLPSLLSEQKEDVAVHETRYAQPSLFAVEYALSMSLKAHGVLPSVVMGHSLGEIVASCLAGVMAMEDAMLLVAERSRLMQEQPAGGSMVAVFAGEAEVQEALARHVGEGVAIAAVNGPKLTVIAGPEGAVAAIVAETNAKHQRLEVSHAFHSPLMGHVARELRQVLEGIELRSPVGPPLLISNVTGAVATAEVCTAEYWCRHVLQPVLFQRGVEAMVADKVDVVVEIGPRPVLTNMAQRCLSQTDRQTRLSL